MLAGALSAERPDPAQTEFLADVVAGLSQKQKRLPPKYFYDDVGSALFEAITALPEYGLTRAEERLLEQHAGHIGSGVGSGARIVELGSGSGRKTRHILETFRQPKYHPIDVSAAALDQCRRELRAFADVRPHQGTYLDGLRVILAGRGREPVLILFLGSTIGNFDRRTGRIFLRNLHGLLQEGDAVLIGFDLMKSREQLLAAYDDPPGVTAAFNRNVLARINRELGGNFDLRSFEHEARFNEREHRVEMHLSSCREQAVEIAAAGRRFRFREAETIWTESSHKFRAQDLPLLARAAGFREADKWVDAEWQFAESLWFA